MCKLVKFFQCYATYGATYALVALSIDRFDAITRPLSMGGVGRLFLLSSWGSTTAESGAKIKLEKHIKPFTP